MRSFTKGFLKLVAWVAGVLLVFAAIMRIFFVDVAVVGHNAMAPTLEANDTILLWRSAVPDEMGDVTICDHPANPGELVMGRVVGKGGMTLEVDRYQRLTIEGSTPDIDWSGTLSFNDAVQGHTASYNRGIVELGNVEHEIMHREDSAFRLPRTTVEEGKIFLLSDNRMHPGQDSRYFGTVPLENCHGVVFMRLAPAGDSPNDLGHNYLDIIH